MEVQLPWQQSAVKSEPFEQPVECGSTWMTMGQSDLMGRMQSSTIGFIAAVTSRWHYSCKFFSLGQTWAPSCSVEKLGEMLLIILFSKPTRACVSQGVGRNFFLKNPSEIQALMSGCAGHQQWFWEPEAPFCRVCWPKSAGELLHSLGFVSPKQFPAISRRVIQALKHDCICWQTRPCWKKRFPVQWGGEIFHPSCLDIFPTPAIRILLFWKIPEFWLKGFNAQQQENELPADLRKCSLGCQNLFLYPEPKAQKGWDPWDVPADLCHT